MNIDIRKSVIAKIKDDDENSLIKTIDQSTASGDELILPGLGVMLELFWDNLNKNDKLKLAQIIKKNTSS